MCDFKWTLSTGLYFKAIETGLWSTINDLNMQHNLYYLKKYLLSEGYHLLSTSKAEIIFTMTRNI